VDPTDEVLGSDTDDALFDALAHTGSLVHPVSADG
jgi:hypothetical protein